MQAEYRAKLEKGSEQASRKLEIHNNGNDFYSFIRQKQDESILK